MHSAHYLNATDLDEITRHRRLLTHQQRVELDAIHYRLDTFPQRFARGPRYAQTAGLVLLSEWERRRKFCHCCIGYRACDLWKLCDHCSYRRRTALLERFLTQFSRSRWWFLTVSFDGVLPFEGHFAEDMGLYWTACHKAVRALVDDGSFLGAVKIEELHVESLLPLVVLPHCHFLIAAEDVTVSQIEELQQLVLAHRGSQPDWAAGEALTDDAERVALRVMLKCSPIPTVGDLARVLSYMIKPLDLVTPYLSAWPVAALNEREGVPELNADVVEFFDGHAENCYSRHQLDYMGILDGRTGERCIAVPKPTRQQPAHKARVGALLRQCADEATDELAFERVAIESEPLRCPRLLPGE
jgi:hypothetical protein